MAKILYCVGFQVTWETLLSSLHSHYVSFQWSCHRQWHASTCYTKLISRQWHKIYGVAVLEIHYMPLNQMLLGISIKDLFCIRLRIGHTRLTHSCLLSGHHQPECVSCHCPLIVKHFLLDCTDFNDVRKKSFAASSMKDLFENVNLCDITDFVKTHFYKLL